jgi:GABA(A) receptor-associated protein
MSSTLSKKQRSQQFKYCQSTFQDKYPIDRRKEQSHSIRAKYPDKLPVIIEKLKNISSHIDDIPKSKYLIPEDLIVSQLMCIIRKYLNLTSADSIYLFSNDTLLSTSETLYTTYGKYKADDGFLYIYYTSENTFGG